MSIPADDCLLSDCCLTDVQSLLDKQTKALLAKLETKLDLLVAKLEENPIGQDLTTGFKHVKSELAKMADRLDQQEAKLSAIQQEVKQTSYKVRLLDTWAESKAH